ncbi:MAG: hypothetical protein NPIRA06_21140 [Nitrospirales bacterium]|nr:MAG: hypothetical protein NPIRA06_21140 [Nitrospirales bacterium]
MDEEEIFLRVYRAKSWQKRARACAKDGKKDLDGEFIFWWIALNALYGQPRERLEVRERYRRQNIDELHNIKDFLQDVSSSSHVGKALSDPHNPKKQNRDDVLENVFLRKEIWNQLSTTEDLDSGTIWGSIEKTVEAANKNLKNGELGQYLKPIFEQLYVLRNQIIHGASKEQSRANRRSLTSAVPVLAELVPVFIKAVEDHGHNIRSDGIPYSPFKGKKSSKHPLLEQDFKGPPDFTGK